MNKQPKAIQFAQDFPNIAACGPHVAGGFNARIQGEEIHSAIRGAYRWEREQGWWAADKKIAAGKVYFVHPFPHGKCRTPGFIYGGTWACNECNSDGFQKPWWKVRVMKDGTVWCVVSEGFEDLQASSNYAFGDTKQEALDAYAALMASAA